MTVALAALLKSMVSVSASKLFIDRVVVATTSFSDPGEFSSTKIIVGRLIPLNVFFRNASRSTTSMSLNSDQYAAQWPCVGSIQNSHGYDERNAASRLYPTSNGAIEERDVKVYLSLGNLVVGLEEAPLQ